MSKKFNYVYITSNLINGKQYVGDHSTNKLNDGYLGSGNIFVKKINEYGKENFKKEILEFFDSKEEAFNAQEKYIIEYNTLVPNGYNINPHGGYTTVDCHSEKTKKQMSISAKGRISPNKGKKFSAEWKKNIGKHKKGKSYEEMYGKEMAEKIRNKIGKSGLGKRKGIKLSDETRRNMSIAKTGKKLSIRQLEARKYIKKKKCPHCKKEYIPQHYNRSHGDKCKCKKI